MEIDFIVFNGNLDVAYHMVMLAGKIFIAGIDLNLRGMNDWTTDSLPVQNLYMKYPLWISLVSCFVHQLF